MAVGVVVRRLPGPRGPGTLASGSSAPRAAIGRVSGLCRALCAVLLVAWIGEAPIWFDPVLYEGHWRSPLAVLGFLLVPIPGIRLLA